MQYALVDGYKRKATPGARGICPQCEEEVIAKCGEINIWHWAHKASSDCDSFSEPETPWHRGWKDDVLSDYCEVVIERDGKKHRADILGKDGTVIELQHSSIGSKDIRKREEFYRDMIWLLDYRDHWPNFEFRSIKGRDAFFKWQYPRRSFEISTVPIFIHIGEYLNLIEYGEIFDWKKYYSLKLQSVVTTTTNRQVPNSPLPDDDWIFCIEDIRWSSRKGKGMFLTVSEFKENHFHLKPENSDPYIQKKLL